MVSRGVNSRVMSERDQGVVTNDYVMVEVIVCRTRTKVGDGFSGWG